MKKKKIQEPRILWPSERKSFFFPHKKRKVNPTLHTLQRRGILDGPWACSAPDRASKGPGAKLSRVRYPEKKSLSGENNFFVDDID